MALDRDELNRRRRAREAQRRRKQQAQRRMMIRLAAAALILLVSGVAIFLLTRDKEPDKEISSTNPPVTENQTEASDVTGETAQPTEELASWEKENAVVHIVAAGDLNVTDQTVWSGLEESTYDYTGAFMDVAAIFSEADMAMLNFEGTVSGMPYGTASGSAPVEMIEALKNAGVDVVQVANSCSVNSGISGLVTTLANIRAAGMEPVGAYSSAEEFQKSKGYTICNIGDVKIALVAFTKGMGGRGLPVGSEDCVNVLYTDYSSNYQEVDEEGIKAVLRAAESEEPDLTIAMLHWGSEYNEIISKTQKSIAKLMLENNVDVILGTHPHMVHEITYDETTGQLVAYSLGDFFGDGDRNGTQYSIILDLEITKDYDAGVTKVTDFSYTPIYTLSAGDSAGNRRVVRIENAMSAYEMNYVDKVTDACYADMEYSLSRIKARVKGE